MESLRPTEGAEIQTSNTDANTAESDRTRRCMPSAVWIVVALLGIAAAALILFITRDGVGVLNDSQSYVQMAQRLSPTPAPLPIVKSDLPISRHYPPGYPLLLVVGSMLGVEYGQFARWLNAILIFGSGLLVAQLLFVATQSRFRAILAATLFLVSAGTLQAHLLMLSEASFQFVVLLNALALGAYLHSVKTRWLIATAILAAAAMMVRYAAAALILSEILAILLVAGRSYWRRLIDCLVVGIAPAIALFAWTLPAGHAAAADRKLLFQPIDPDRLKDALEELGQWIVWNGGHEGLVYITGFIELGFIFWILWIGRNWLRNSASRIGGAVESVDVHTAMPWTFVVVYPAFLFTTLFFFDGAMPLDARLLLPLHLMVIVVGCALFPLQTRVQHVAVGLLVAMQTVTMGVFLTEARQLGLGYASNYWTQSELSIFIKSLPSDAKFYANNPLAFEQATDRTAKPIPYAHPKVTAAMLEDARLDFIRRAKKSDGRSFVVYLRKQFGAGRTYLLPDRLDDGLTFTPLLKTTQGTIFEVSRPKDAAPTTRTKD